MQATQTQAVHATTGIPVVTEAQARENARRVVDQKAARKAAKALQARIADEAREQRRREREAAEADALAKTAPILVVTPVVPSKLGLIRLPTRESIATLEKSKGDAAANLLRHKREQAQLAARRIYDWMVNAIPSYDEVVKELRAALFVPIEGDETGYRCEGVVIHTDEVGRVKLQDARDAKRRVLDVLRGTDITAKLAVLESEGFEFSHEDDRGNKVYSRVGIEVTLFLNQRRDFVATDATPRPHKARGSELVALTAEDHERNRKAKLAAKLARKPAPAEKKKVDKKAEKEAKKNKKGGK